jgi:hypothetical protein
MQPNRLLPPAAPAGRRQRRCRAATSRRDTSSVAKPAVINSAASVRRTPVGEPVTATTGAVLAVLDAVLDAVLEAVVALLVVEVGLVRHRELVKVFVSRVTEPVRASARPSTLAFVVTLPM